MTDLIRQWNRAVEQFDEQTAFHFDRLPAEEIVGIASERRMDIAGELWRLWVAIYVGGYGISVDSPAVKVG